MKKISFAILTAALALLSGCNKEHSTISSAEDLFIESETDVRFIKLGGMASATTRASIESFDEMSDPMGVFCLAARKTDIKSAMDFGVYSYYLTTTDPRKGRKFKRIRINKKRR